MKKELTLDMYLEQSEYIDYHDLEIQKPRGNKEGINAQFSIAEE